MSLVDWLGRSTSLTVVRFGSPGAFLAEAAAAPGVEVAEVAEGSASRDVVLLLGAEIPEGAAEGDVLDVFVYRDSEGRLLATRQRPKVELGEVAFLEATSTTEFGAFFAWGLAKDLLVPFKEQTTPIFAGARHPIGLYVDDTGRLAGTMRVSELLRSDAAFEEDEWVEGEAWRNEPEIGLFVIVERAVVGLVPASEPHRLGRGDAARFRVSNVLPDGKIELSLRGHAHEELAGDAAHILEVLQRPNAVLVGDKSSPDVIRDVFGLSKKAFKRAAGRLLREGHVKIDHEGWFRVATSASSPPR